MEKIFQLYRYSTSPTGAVDKMAVAPGQDPKSKSVHLGDRVRCTFGGTGLGVHMGGPGPGRSYSMGHLF